jgi:hypothetical protein
MRPVLVHKELLKNYQNDNIKHIFVQMCVDQLFTLLLPRLVANSFTLNDELPYQTKRSRKTRVDFY